MNSSDNFSKISILNINDLYWQGKYATEYLIFAIPFFLLFLVLFGYLLQRKKRRGLGLIILLPLMFTANVNAICPVCTVAIGAGLGFSRYYGIDDLIMSIWMGGLVISSIMWILNWLEKRGKRSSKMTIITYLITYILVIIPLLLGNVIGIPGNRVWGIDKVLGGIVFGGILFLIGVYINIKLKNINANKPFFPFQKVVCPITLLWIGTIIGYYIIYYF